MSVPVTSARRDRAWLLGLFVVGLVLRVAHVATIRDSPFFEWLMLDPRMYDEWARRIAAGDWLGTRPFFQDPLYPYLLAVVYRVAGLHYTPVVVLQAILGATIAPLVFAATRRWLGFGAAAVAGVFGATYLPSVYYEGMILKTALATWLVTVGFWLLARRLVVTVDETRQAGPGTFAGWAGLGVVFGLATLARGNLLLFVPVLALWLFLDAPIGVGHACRGRARFGDRRVQATAMAFFLGAAVVIGVVAVRNRVVGDEWILTTSNAGQNFYIGNNPTNATGQYAKLPFVDANPQHEERGFAREATARARRDGALAADATMPPGEVSRYWFRESLAWIGADPTAWIGLMWRKVRVYWGAYEVPDNLDYYLYRESAPVLRLPLPGFGLVAPLGLLGGFLLWRRPGWPRALLLFLVVYVASVVLFFVFSRFRMPMMPVLFVFAGYAVTTLWGAVAAVRAKGADRAARRRLAALAVMGTLAFAWVHLPVRARPSSLAYRVAAALHLPRRAESSAQGHFNLGVAYAAQAKDSGDAERLLALAEAELRAAIAADMPFASVHVELGKVLARQQRNDEAIAEYRIAAELEPRDYRNHHAIGLLERRNANLGAASAAFRSGTGTRAAPRRECRATRRGPARAGPPRRGDRRLSTRVAHESGERSRPSRPGAKFRRTLTSA